MHHRISFLAFLTKHKRCYAAERPKLSDPAHEGVRLQPGRDGRVRCSAWLGRVVIGLKSKLPDCGSHRSKNVQLHRNERRATWRPSKNETRHSHRCSTLH